MAKRSDLNTTAIENLQIQVQDNEDLLTALTNYITKFSNDSILSILGDMLSEMQITNAHLKNLLGDDLLDPEETDNTLNVEV